MDIKEFKQLLEECVQARAQDEAEKERFCADNMMALTALNSPYIYSDFLANLRERAEAELLKENNMKKGDLFDPPFTMQYLHDCVDDELSCIDKTDVFKFMTAFCDKKYISALYINEYWDEFLDFVYDKTSRNILDENNLTFDDLSNND